MRSRLLHLRHRLPVVLGSLLAGTACYDSTAPIVNGPRSAASRGGSFEVVVSNTAQLYAAVNDPTNAGRRIVANPNTYLLDPAQTHNGRLELQHDMELVGATGKASDVVIDASALTTASFTTPLGLTGAVRIGLGTNAVEGLTIRNASKGSAGIETDLVEAGVTRLRIANVHLAGNQRGVDIKNQGAASAARVLEAELVDNEMSDNVSGNGQGVRVVNASVTGGTIHVTLKRNRSHNNLFGCLAANLHSTNSVIEIESQDDRFSGNGNGCLLLGGISTTAATSTGNSIAFRAHASQFADNTGSLSSTSPGRGGLLALGATSVQPGNTSNNSLRVELWGAKMENNGGPDIAAWGAQTKAPSPAGTYNTAWVAVHGPSVSTFRRDSDPDEPARTNRATIVQH